MSYYYQSGTNTNQSTDDQRPNQLGPGLGQGYPMHHQHQQYLQSASGAYPHCPPPQQQQQQQQYGSNNANPSNNPYRQPSPPQQYPQQYQGNNRGPSTQQQQTDYSKYQFLPYGQPMPPQQQQFAGYNQYQQHYATASQGETSYNKNQNEQNQSYNYSAYGQGQQGQPPTSAGGGYYQQNIYTPNYGMSGNAQFTTAPPLPVPAPVPPPAVPPPPPPPSSQPKSTLDQNKGDSGSSKSSRKSSHKKGHKEVKEVKKEEQEWLNKSEQESEPKETKKSVPIMVGKRRGGRTLPTGVVKKQRAESPEEGKRTDPWSQYMNEVKRYKDQSCEEDRKNRPLVK